uniref:Uncharacterized protein n=1 Tax=Picea glauca TaxID=3330 RepID=A0A101LVS8_PICGL|nr:hypothetical protein ABT39_MTgene1753 [Picea glauca]
MKEGVKGRSCALPGWPTINLFPASHKEYYTDLRKTHPRGEPQGRGIIRSRIAL